MIYKYSRSFIKLLGFYDTNNPNIPLNRKIREELDLVTKIRCNQTNVEIHCQNDLNKEDKIKLDNIVSNYKIESRNSTPIIEEIEVSKRFGVCAFSGETNKVVTFKPFQLRTVNIQLSANSQVICWFSLSNKQGFQINTSTPFNGAIHWQALGR